MGQTNSAKLEPIIGALGYAKALARSVFAMDNALYLEDLSPEGQPGLKVRRIGKGIDRPSDQLS